MTALNNLNRLFVGLDRFPDLLDSNLKTSNYPPHDLIKIGDDEYQIRLAVAGFKPDDFEIVTHKDNLIVRGTNKDGEDEKTYLHKGIALRSFTKSFYLTDYIEVTNARMDNGMLTITLTRVVPESAKPKSIPIITD
jgi:molecular chaperone IbpA